MRRKYIPEKQAAARKKLNGERMLVDESVRVRAAAELCSARHPPDSYQDERQDFAKRVSFHSALSESATPCSHSWSMRLPMSSKSGWPLM
jgi:hypothetical protein